TAVGLPLYADGRRLGHLVLLLGETPDAALRAMLTSFATHVALALRSAQLYRRVGDKEEQLTSVVHCMANPVLVVDEAARFVLIIGHELRTPLTVMKCSLRTLVHRGETLDSHVRELALKAIESNADRLQRLIEDVLYVSAVETGRSNLHLEDVDLGVLVDAVVQERVRVKRPRKDLTLGLDTAKVQQVLHH